MKETQVNDKMKETEAVDDKTTTCIIGKALNKNNKPLLKNKYKERFKKHI